MANEWEARREICEVGRRMYERSFVAANDGNISYRLGGQKLQIDPNTEHIVDNPDAMALFKRTYREPWVIPEQV